MTFCTQSITDPVTTPLRSDSRKVMKSAISSPDADARWRRRPRSYFSAADRTTTTGQWLRMISDWLVEPKRIPENPPRPWLPTTSN
jgi:hypothetical protein